MAIRSPWNSCRNGIHRLDSYGVPDMSTISDEAVKAAIRTLDKLGYTFRGGALWKPPIGPKPDFDAIRAKEVGAVGEADALGPIERDEQYDRTYIPLPGGWEIQTKGKGSTFRIAGPDDNRLPICHQPYLFELLEQMARDVHREYSALRSRQPTLCPHIITGPYIEGVASANYCRLNGPPAQAVPEGWKPVPIEPVGQMAKAARERHELDGDDGVVDWFAIVADAIAAAPEPPK